MLKIIYKSKFTYLIILSSIFVAVLLYFKKNDKPNARVSLYSNCDHKHNATIPVLPCSVLKDKNEVHLLHAQRNGLKQPIATNALFDSTISILVEKIALVEVKDNRFYHIKSLKHSHPYLIPEAVDMVNEIAFRFQEKLKEQKLPNYCFLLTSMLRTEETQFKLSKRNRNATNHSAHFYGTTIDISYKEFYNMDKDTVENNWEAIQELRKTLVEMREECKLLAVKERKQSCFHITVVVCKAQNLSSK